MAEHIEMWQEFEIFGGEPMILLGVYYFQDELTGKIWAKKFGARSTKFRAVAVVTTDGLSGILDGREIHLRCVRPETNRTK